MGNEIWRAAALVNCSLFDETGDLESSGSVCCSHFEECHKSVSRALERACNFGLYLGFASRNKSLACNFQNFSQNVSSFRKVCLHIDKKLTKSKQKHELMLAS